LGVLLAIFRKNRWKTRTGKLNIKIASIYGVLRERAREEGGDKYAKGCFKAGRERGESGRRSMKSKAIQRTRTKEPGAGVVVAGIGGRDIRSVKKRIPR